jgi:hypothetical protein
MWYIKMYTDPIVVISKVECTAPSILDTYIVFVKYLDITYI